MGVGAPSCYGAFLVGAVAHVGAEVNVRRVNALAVIALGLETRFGLGALGRGAALGNDALVFAADLPGFTSELAGAGVAIALEAVSLRNAEIVVGEFEADAIRCIAGGVAAGTQVGRHAVAVGCARPLALVTEADEIFTAVGGFFAVSAFRTASDQCAGTLETRSYATVLIDTALGKEKVAMRLVRRERVHRHRDNLHSARIVRREVANGDRAGRSLFFANLSNTHFASIAVGIFCAGLADHSARRLASR